jgi:hypothetical protein
MYLHLSRHEPWRLRRSNPLVDLAHALRGAPGDDFLPKGNILRQFICFMRKLETIPEGLARQLLHPTDRGPLPGVAPKG